LKLKTFTTELDHLSFRLDLPSFDLKTSSLDLNLSLSTIVALFCGGNRIRRNRYSQLQKLCQRKAGQVSWYSEKNVGLVEIKERSRKQKIQTIELSCTHIF
jgi:hypothetical protein